MTVGAAQARQAVGGFTPLDLALRWYIDPDRTTDIVSAEINSIADAKGTGTASAAGSTNRMPLDTSDRPGHQVATGGNNDHLDGAFSSADDVESVNFWLFAVVRSLSNSTVNPILTIFTGGGHSIKWGFGDGTTLSTTGMFMRFLDGTGTSTVNITFTRDTTTYHLFIAAFTFSTRTVQIYQDNVSKGSAAQSVSRDPTGLTRLDYGGSGGSAGQSAKYGPMGCCLGAPTLAERTNLYNYYRAYDWLD